MPCIYWYLGADLLVRAPDCGSGGRRFETDLPPLNNKGLQKCSPFFCKNLPTNLPLKFI